MPSTLKILVSVDFDAVSGWLGTGASPENTLSDYSTGFFAARVGVPRLLKLFKRLSISDKVTWFIPGHSAESFPVETKAIIDSGAEIGLHGYCHEDLNMLTEAQEREVLEKCMSIFQELTGRTARGYRAPLYKLREHSIQLLEEHGFLYDSSLSMHDSKCSFLPKGGGTPIQAPKYSPGVKPSSWMKPLPQVDDPLGAVVEVPGNWYMEDMTPMQFWPHTPNSHGYVPASTVGNMWTERLDFLLRELEEQDDELENIQDDELENIKDNITVFPLILHPDTSGMAHILPMIERFLKNVIGKGDKVEFITFEKCVELWKSQQTPQQGDR
jgi:peptidoglycan/xylan/chitin deacetylase (PgdA/CDA1 family)